MDRKKAGGGGKVREGLACLGSWQWRHSTSSRLARSCAETVSSGGDTAPAGLHAAAQTVGVTGLHHVFSPPPAEARCAAQEVQEPHFRPHCGGAAVCWRGRAGAAAGALVAGRGGCAVTAAAESVRWC